MRLCLINTIALFTHGCAFCSSWVILSFWSKQSSQRCHVLMQSMRLKLHLKASVQYSSMVFFFFFPQRQEKENILHNKNLNCSSALYCLMPPDMMLRKTYLLNHVLWLTKRYMYLSTAVSYVWSKFIVISFLCALIFFSKAVLFLSSTMFSNSCFKYCIKYAQESCKSREIKQ